jgi:hypothetical protein
MVRDIYAVPASNAGVKYKFSKSGRVATSSRGRVGLVTVTESMMFKGHIVRKGAPVLDDIELMNLELSDCEEVDEIRKYTNGIINDWKLD